MSNNGDDIWIEGKGADDQFIEDLDEELDQVNSRLEDLENRVDDHDDAFESVTNWLEDLSDDLGSIEGDINSFETRLNNYQNRLTKVENEIEDLDVDINVPGGERTANILNPMNYFEGNYSLEQFDDIAVSERSFSTYVKNNSPEINNLGEHMSEFYRNRAKRTEGMDPDDVINPYGSTSSDPEKPTEPEVDDPDKRDSLCKIGGALIGAGFIGGSLAAIFWPDDDKTVYKESGSGDQSINRNGGTGGSGLNGTRTDQGPIGSENPNYFEDLDALNSATDDRDLTAREVESYLDVNDRTDLEASDVDFGYSGGSVTIYSEDGNNKIVTITEDF
ncbi:MAG: hypothetical protein H8Z69_02905 [Nanohaloarchaea archaeon]|nr:hypothetical protein [Candidatus Nanohaloarchaea archaeon]